MMRVLRTTCLATILIIVISATVPFTAHGQTGKGNRPERLEWFRDLGFGMFIHWNVDGTLGGVISRSMVGASDDFNKRYIDLLPKVFNPRKYNPDDWAALAKLAGMQYVVFTTKHHAGFCMFDTKTTDFSVMNTPYGKDITAQLVKAFRAHRIAVGFYYSPDDFYYLYKHGKPIARAPHPGVRPQDDKAFLEYDRAQIRELLTNYGPIDIMFLDGPPEGLRELCWELQPNIVVTRGAIETPEQRIPGVPLEGAWESCLTMGTEWPYKPTNESYKSGGELIRILIETRAKGGNLLLNVGPKPDGELPIEQEDRLREVALWNFVNGEAITAVRPWVVTNEGSVWFTKKKSEETVYAFVTEPWNYGEPKTIRLRSIKATRDTQVSVLGQTGEILEYRPEVLPRSKWEQTESGLAITAWKAQRLYTDRKWPNPVVLKISNVSSSIVPPQVTTLLSSREGVASAVVLTGRLESLGNAATVEVGFQYRAKRVVRNTEENRWQESKFVAKSQPGAYTMTVDGLEAGRDYEFRAVVKHPLVTIFGREMMIVGSTKDPEAGGPIRQP